MPIRVVCQCGAKFDAREQLAGKETECAACGQKVRVPHQPAGGRGTWPKGPVVAVMTLLGAGVLACGGMLYLLQGRVDDLRAELAQTKTAAQARIQAEELAERKAAEEAKKAQEKLEALQAELQAETKTRTALAEKLRDAQAETGRVRSDLQRVESERAAALAAETAKRAKLDAELSRLEGDLAKKASADEAQTIKAQIAKLEEEKAKLAAAAAATNAKVAGYDRQIDDLNRDLANKIVAQDKLKADLAAADGKLTTLKTNADTFQTVDLPAKLNDLKQELRAKQAPEVETVVAEGASGSCSLSIDTRTGESWCFVPPGMSPSVAGIAEQAYGPNVAWSPDAETGRFLLKVSMLGSAPHWALRLDTQTGNLWRMDFATSSWPYLQWERIWHPHWGGQAASTSDRWSLGLSSQGSPVGRAPLVTLTAPDGTVYDNALNLLGGILLLPR